MCYPKYFLYDDLLSNTYFYTNFYYITNFLYKCIIQHIFYTKRCYQTHFLYKNLYFLFKNFVIYYVLYTKPCYPIQFLSEAFLFNTSSAIFLTVYIKNRLKIFYCIVFWYKHNFNNILLLQCCVLLLFFKIYYWYTHRKMGNNNAMLQEKVNKFHFQQKEQHFQK